MKKLAKARKSKSGLPVKRSSRAIEVRPFVFVQASPETRPGVSELKVAVGAQARKGRVRAAAVVAAQTEIPTPLAKFAEGSINHLKRHRGPITKKVVRETLIVGTLNTVPSLFKMLVDAYR